MYSSKSPAAISFSTAVESAGRPSNLGPQLSNATWFFSADCSTAASIRSMLNAPKSMNSWRILDGMFSTLSSSKSPNATAPVPASRKEACTGSRAPEYLSGSVRWQRCLVPPSALWLPQASPLVRW